MIEIGLSGIKKTFGFKNVLDDFNFEASTGERIALIGVNGSGKTTLFKIINGDEGIDSGSLAVRKGATIGLLSQIPSKEDDSCLVKDILSRNLQEIFDLENKIRKLEKEMADPNNKYLETTLKKYDNASLAFEKIGGYAASTKISKITGGFKIKEELLNQRFNTLSGGEKTIVSLASLMINEPSILLLDEPTNHLDIDTLEWFEDYLNNYKGTIIISSHDRYFLDRVTTKTVLIDRGQAEIFHGNYSYYLKENEKRELIEFESYKNQQKMIEAMKASIKRLQEFGKLAHPNGENFFKRAASIQKRLDKIELLDKPLAKKDLPLDFQLEDRSGKDVLSVKNLRLAIGDKELINNGTFLINYNDKVCIMGKNGTGKSTFIKTLLGHMHPVSGEIKIGSRVKIGYIPQEIKFDNDKETILDYANKSFVGDITQLRSALTKFLFYEDSVFKRVGNLSGGEKVRLKLFVLIQQKANLLILDEPTNHIDIATKETLEEALLDFKGTILFISHDRYFINKLATKIINIENQTFKEYNGNYDYFKNHR